MSSMAEAKKVFKEAAQYQDADSLFGAIDRQLESLIERREADFIPHMVLSHGFMEWRKIVHSQFPELAWRGINAESGSSLTFEQAERYLYERFFLRIKELPVFQGVDEKEMLALKETGWQAYLED